MQLEMSVEQAHDLDALLEVSLKELSHEIAATDNGGYRSNLMARRGRLAEVADLLHRSLERASTVRIPVHDVHALQQDLTHPGG